MGCGCGKKSTVVAPPAASANGRVAAAVKSGSVIMHDVYSGEGALVASFSNPVTARAEARRVGGTVVPRNSNSPIPESTTA